MELFLVIGNLGADAQLITENGKEFVKFNVAETRKWKTEDGAEREETLWNSCIMNGRQDKLMPYLIKGAKVCVIGRGSTRVYSSPKQRCMVAGLNISVDKLELIGATPDPMPRNIVTPTGEIIPVSKAYFIDFNIARANGAKKNEPVQFFDQKQGIYSVDYNGWITPLQTGTDTQEEETKE